MSERGSFVTEYIYCEKCADVAKQMLTVKCKWLCGDSIKTWEGDQSKDLPVVAGKIGALRAGEELDVFENTIVPELALNLCHPLRVAVLAEQGERIFTVQPKSARS